MFLPGQSNQSEISYILWQHISQSRQIEP